MMGCRGREVGDVNILQTTWVIYCQHNGANQKFGKTMTCDTRTLISSSQKSVKGSLCVIICWLHIRLLLKSKHTKEINSVRYPHWMYFWVHIFFCYLQKHQNAVLFSIFKSLHLLLHTLFSKL